MKKTATRISGILTLIFSIFLLLFSLMNICVRFDISGVKTLIENLQFLQVIYVYLSYVFVTLSSGLIYSAFPTIEYGTIEIIFMSVLFTFSLLMVFWGIKEILISHRDDVDFARCKKTCAFMFFIKFVFFLYVLFVIVASFLIEQVKIAVAILELLIRINLGLEYGFLIFTALISLVALTLFLLPTINVLKVAKKVGKDSINNKMAGESLEGDYVTPNENGVAEQQVNQFYNSTPMPTMQANMPPIQGHTPIVSTPQTNSNPNAQNLNTTNNSNVQFTQPNINASQQNNSIAQVVSQNNAINNSNEANVQNINTSSQITNNVNAGQAGMQQNIQNNNTNPPISNVTLSEKAQADLDRLERLKNMGAITPQNYEAMKKKILEGN